MRLESGGDKSCSGIRRDRLDYRLPDLLRGVAHMVGKEEGPSRSHPFLDITDAVPGAPVVTDVAETRVNDDNRGADRGSSLHHPGRGVVADVTGRHNRGDRVIQTPDHCGYREHLGPAGKEDTSLVRGGDTGSQYDAQADQSKAPAEDIEKIMKKEEK